jgi:hypothetical protein
VSSTKIIIRSLVMSKHKSVLTIFGVPSGANDYYFRARHEISGGRVSISKERTHNFDIARRKTG